MISALSLDQLRILTAVADEGSFSAAGRRLLKAIATLVATTGLHPELVQETHSHEEDGKEEHKDDTEGKEPQPAKPVFVSPTPRTVRRPLPSSSSCADVDLCVCPTWLTDCAVLQRYVEVRGDLFSCPDTDALCHCISTDIAMGKGIAVLFKQKFGGVQELRQQQRAIGQVAVLRRDQRYVYYAITKAKYWNKPTYEALQSSLEDMKAHATAHGVSRISMPRIGCGLDGLLWPKVRAILQRVFADTAITITVYSKD